MHWRLKGYVGTKLGRFVLARLLFSFSPSHSGLSLHVRERESAPEHHNFLWCNSRPPESRTGQTEIDRVLCSISLFLQELLYTLQNNENYIRPAKVRGSEKGVYSEPPSVSDHQDKVFIVVNGG
jgi:hypothetical protein